VERRPSQTLKCSQDMSAEVRLVESHVTALFRERYDWTAGLLVRLLVCGFPSIASDYDMAIPVERAPRRSAGSSRTTMVLIVFLFSKRSHARARSNALTRNSSSPKKHPCGQRCHAARLQAHESDPLSITNHSHVPCGRYSNRT
jgi:hypothetical protein